MARTPELTYQVDLPGGQKRLREAALYVIEKCQHAEWFGLVKLNKMLWRADFEAFATRGQPVTGRQYQRLRHGPAPVEMPSVLNELKKDGYVEVDVTPVYSYVEHRPRAIVGADLRQFSAEDIGYLDSGIRFYFDQTAGEVSRHSHGVAWSTRGDGDPMPYELARLSDEPIERDLEGRLLTMGANNGWLSRQMRSIIWSEEFARLVALAGGSRIVDQALDPIIDGLMRRPYGFQKIENDYTSFRVARTRAIPGVLGALVVVFTIDADKNIVLEWLEEDLPF